MLFQNVVSTKKLNSKHPFSKSEIKIFQVCVCSRTPPYSKKSTLYTKNPPYIQRIPPYRLIRPPYTIKMYSYIKVMSRFLINADGSYTKYITVNDVCYKLTISKDEWENISHRKIKDHIAYWKRDPSKTLRYGKYEVVHTIPTTFKCDICSKSYKSRTGYLYHIKTKHSNPAETPIETPSTPEVTTQNIENQTNNITNNIQQNITIRPFGKENPKWITEKVIIDALRNIPCAIMNLVKEKHFNDKFPENRNVELCSEFRNRYLTVQEDSRKKIVDRKAMFLRMCDNACDAVTTTLESYSEPPDSDESEDEDESPEDRRCRLVANRIRRSAHFSAVVDRYIDKWQDYVAEVEHDEVLKKADHYITMLLLDLKLALAHEEEMINTREVAE